MHSGAQQLQISLLELKGNKISCWRTCILSRKIACLTKPTHLCIDLKKQISEECKSMSATASADPVLWAAIRSLLKLSLQLFIAGKAFAVLAVGLELAVSYLLQL